MSSKVCKFFDFLSAVKLDRRFCIIFVDSHIIGRASHRLLHQYLKGGYGSVDMGAMMGTLVLAIVPIIIFYLFCQRYIIEGVVAGAVKG